jgi:hypothetical protein
LAERSVLHAVSAATAPQLNRGSSYSRPGKATLKPITVFRRQHSPLTPGIDTRASHADPQRFLPTFFLAAATFAGALSFGAFPRFL